MCAREVDWCKQYATALKSVGLKTGTRTGLWGGQRVGEATVLDVMFFGMVKILTMGSLGSEYAGTVRTAGANGTPSDARAERHEITLRPCFPLPPGVI